MDIDIIKAAAEITKEAVAKTPATMSVGPVSMPDVVTAFLDKVARKLNELYKEV